MKTQPNLKICFISLLICLLHLCASFKSFAQNLTIYTCNVGQGDGILITTSAGKSMLIDGGNTNAGREEILSRLSSLGITNLNYIIASHYDADHITNIARILISSSGITVDSVYDRGTDNPPATQAYTDYVSAVSSKRFTIHSGQKLNLGSNVTVTSVSVNGKWSQYDSLIPRSENERSVGLLVEYGQFKYFAAGDLEYAIEDTIGNHIGDISVLKAQNHGSKNSSSHYFLSKTAPDAVLISVGSPNSPNHPAQETLNRMDSTSSIKHIYQTTTGDGGTSSKVQVLGTIITKVWSDSFTIGSNSYVVVPIELSSFTVGIDKNNCIVLKWNTLSETNNLGFEIERSSDGKHFYEIGFQKGNGITSISHEYVFSDTDFLIGKNYYRLKQIDYDGKYSYSDIVTIFIEKPTQFMLYQNYPNPFNSSTHIKYQLPERQFVFINIFDITGKKIRTLVNEYQSSGFKEIFWDGMNDSGIGVASGIYIYRIQAGNFTQANKMILLK